MKKTAMPTILPTILTHRLPDLRPVDSTGAHSRAKGLGPHQAATRYTQESPEIGREGEGEGEAGEGRECAIEREGSEVVGWEPLRVVASGVVIGG